MKISIIMGVYNGVDRFEESINSILRQTYTNWEFIICDDNSNDESYEKLKKLYGNDEKFIIIRNEKNIGLAKTLNNCLNYATGEYIARMDDDDISYSTRFEEQVKFLENHKEISFVSSAIDVYDGDNIVSKRAVIPFPEKKDLIWNSPFVHPATMFRKEDLMKVGGYRVSKETKRGQDYDLFMRLYARGYKGANIEQPLFRYTVTSTDLNKRTFAARRGEMIIRYKGYKDMRIPFYDYVFVLKPLLAHLKLLLEKKIMKKR